MPSQCRLLKIFVPDVECCLIFYQLLLAVIVIVIVNLKLEKVDRSTNLVRNFDLRIDSNLKQNKLTFNIEFS